LADSQNTRNTSQRLTEPVSYINNSLAKNILKNIFFTSYSQENIFLGFKKPIEAESSPFETAPAWALAKYMPEHEKITSLITGVAIGNSRYWAFLCPC
jgi:hypothetical protein